LNTSKKAKVKSKKSKTVCCVSRHSLGLGEVEGKGKNKNQEVYMTIISFANLKNCECARRSAVLGINKELGLR